MCHKKSFIIYADLKFLIEKIDGCKNNPEKSFTKKISKQISLGYLLSTTSSCKNIENKYDIYRDIP